VAVELLLGAGRPEPAGDAKRPLVERELARFQGTWQLVSAEADGVKAPWDWTDKIRVVIKGSRHAVMFGDKEVAHSIPFAIDPTTTPKSVVDTLEAGPDVGEQIKGIYNLEGDTLTSCVARTGEERPTGFASKPGTGHTLRVFGRVNDMGDSQAKVVEAELERFEGTWRFESLIVEGREVPPEGLQTSRLTLKGDTFEMTDPMATYRGTFRIDPSVTPKRIAMAFTEGPEAGKTVLGIYELDGDTYKVCVGLAGRGRPEGFASKTGSGHALEVLKREKP
jgi:uncharacterized protein (TIGR03067 family)